MLNNILNTVEEHKMLEHEDHVVLGLSGGADSVLLLHSLIMLSQEYNLKISAVHINHGIRGCDADSDEAFTRRLCESLNISIEVYKYDIKEIARLSKITVEEAGRKMRYTAFEETLNKLGADKIAVAHNMNDNAETMLMNFIRGTGMRGLAGIPPVRGRIIRPLINVSRDEIEKYLNENNIKYINDISNNDVVYTRNKIRIEMLPYIKKEINNGIINSLSCTADIIAAENDYMEEAAAACYRKYTDYEENEEKPLLNIEKLKSEHPAMQRRLLRMAAMKLRPELKDISYIHISKLLELMSKPGKIAELPGSIRVINEYGYLRFYIETGIESGFCYDLTIGGQYLPKLGMYVNAELLTETGALFNGKDHCFKIFDYDKIRNKPQIRTRNDGDRIFVKSMGGNKKIKDYFIDRKIPRDKRDKIPLIADGGSIMWIMDDKSITNDNYKPDFETKRILLIRIANETYM